MRFLLFAILISLGTVHHIAIAQSWNSNYLFEEMVQSEMKGHSQFSFSESLESQNYDVTYYRLAIEVSTSSTFINGEVTVFFIPNQPISTIYFDLTDSLHVDSVTYNGSSISFSHSNQKIAISQSFSENILDSITLYYHGNPPSNSTAFVLGEHDGTPILWTLSEPYGAIDWWPCKQSLTDKADSLDVFITAPAGNKVSGNGVLISETNISSLQTITHWKSRYPIVPYLVAFSVTPYAEISFHTHLPHGNLLIQNYVYHEDSVDVIDQLNSTDSILVLLDSLVGPYPFMNEKYGHAQFERGGGMEHQTMSFMTHFGFGLVAHELAHQWFGNKITCGSWQDLWLNEGFATYFTGVSSEFLHGPQEFFEWKHNALSSIISEPDGSVFVLDTLNVPRLFDSRLTYRKGAYVLHMLRQKVGDEAFFTGVTSYLNDPHLAYKTALTDDFFAHITATSQQDLTTFKNQWIYGQGFPSFSIQWEQKNDIVSFAVNQTTSHSSVGFYQVQLPVLFSNQLGDSLLVTLSPTHSGEEFEIPVNFEVGKIHIDPNLDLISKGNFVIHQEAISSFVSVYPNPTSSILNIIPGGEIQQINGYDIIASNGKTVSSITGLNQSYKLEINVSTLPQGDFTLLIHSGVKKVTSPFVIVR